VGFGLPKLAASAEHLPFVNGALQRLSTPVASPATSATSATSAHSASRPDGKTGSARVIAGKPSAAASHGAHAHPASAGSPVLHPTTKETALTQSESPPRHETMAVTHTWSFDLTQGMPLFDLAQFLANHRLVPNATNFDMAMTQNGMDSDVQPGTYRFHSGMSQAALLQDIKNGPVSS
ncbi:MAG: hypothetical protein OWU32_11525, partial [Firmicutes bacterium]|nr:hypothetical protein [Bacillota bacterium]